MGIPPRVDEASIKRQLSTWLGLGSRMQSDAVRWRGAQELAKEVSRTKGVAVAMEIAAQGLAEGMDMVAGLIWAPTLTLVKWGCGRKAARNFASEQSKRTLLIHNLCKRLRGLNQAQAPRQAHLWQAKARPPATVDLTSEMASSQEV